ncbi:substrate-binding periplasmic protein [Loktanella sp. M215]|uniref:substrate-binding periplasmic protein n=1 Tax=Loktanella sp. M215 TaxID=2675431 RepID=UPI001F1D13FF|nr:transporter substrate-binding domain-containing protein [Loktanella sp. M215]MBU2358051.1 transporter substrate-binding domain-containing protein [Alphaproteobacteria bacterium]MCF7701845.1 transporter substrate-binding domain-containing protein [Loktanella sp. M215]
MLARPSLALAGLTCLALGWTAPAFAACEGYVPEPKPQNASRDIVGQDLDTIQAQGFITFAAYENFPPWSYAENNQPTGVDIEIGRLIAESLGVEARFDLVPAGETVEADLRNWIWQGPPTGGSVDNVMLHVPYDVNFACRVDQVVFNGQYAKETIAIAYNKTDYPDSPPVPAYFRYDTVGVENDTIADFYLAGIGNGMLIPKMKHYPTVAAAMLAMAAGDVMAVMGPRAQLQAGLTADGDVHQPPLPGLAVGTWTVGLAVHTRYRYLGYAVDDAIRAALDDGRIAEIFASHGLSYDAPQR